MHIKHSHTTVNYIHAIKCSDIGDGSAAAQIYTAKLCGLEIDAIL